MPGTVSGPGGRDKPVGFRTSCGREIHVGRLTLGAALVPVHRVSLDIGAPAGAQGGTWAGLTPGEARRLAAALLLQAAACEQRHT